VITKKEFKSAKTGASAP